MFAGKPAFPRIVAAILDIGFLAATVQVSLLTCSRR